MSQLNVDTIKKADGTGNLSVPAETGTLVIKDGSNDVTLNDITAGGIYLGGTGAANYLDDYEEGTFASGTGGAGNLTSPAWANLVYTKVGRLVTVSGNLTGSIISSSAETQVDLTLPFVLNTNCQSVGAASLLMGTTADRFGVAVMTDGGAGSSVVQIWLAANQTPATGTIGWLKFSFTYETA